MFTDLIKQFLNKLKQFDLNKKVIFYCDALWSQFNSSKFYSGG